MVLAVLLALLPLAAPSSAEEPVQFSTHTGSYARGWDSQILTYPKDAPECQSLCAQDPFCLVYTFVPAPYEGPQPRCHLKTVRQTRVENVAIPVVTGYRERGPVRRPTPPGMEERSDFENGVSLEGNDFETLPINATDCIERCGDVPKCKAVTWIPAGGEGPMQQCHFKDAIPAISEPAPGAVSVAFRLVRAKPVRTLPPGREEWTTAEQPAPESWKESKPWAEPLRWGKQALVLVGDADVGGCSPAPRKVAVKPGVLDRAKPAYGLTEDLRWVPMKVGGDEKAETWLSDSDLTVGVAAAGFDPEKETWDSAPEDAPASFKLPSCVAEPGAEMMALSSSTFDRAEGVLVASQWRGWGHDARGKNDCRWAARVDWVDAQGRCRPLARQASDSEQDENSCGDGDNFSRWLSMPTHPGALVRMPKRLGGELLLLMDGSQYERQFYWLFELELDFKVKRRVEGQAGGC